MPLTCSRSSSKVRAPARSARLAGFIAGSLKSRSFTAGMSKGTARAEPASNRWTYSIHARRLSDVVEELGVLSQDTWLTSPGGSARSLIVANILTIARTAAD